MPDHPKFTRQFALENSQEPGRECEGDRKPVSSIGTVVITLAGALLLGYAVAEPLFELPLSLAKRLNLLTQDDYWRATAWIDAPCRYARIRCVPYQRWIVAEYGWLNRLDLLEEAIEPLPPLAID